MTKGLILIALPKETLEFPDDDQILHLGYIASKKLGNAVVRNRIKRRLREIMRGTLLPLPNQQLCYVIIGRKAAFDRPFDALKKDCVYAYHAVKG